MCACERVVTIETILYENERININLWFELQPVLLSPCGAGFCLNPDVKSLIKNTNLTRILAGQRVVMKMREAKTARFFFFYSTLVCQVKWITAFVKTSVVKKK